MAEEGKKATIVGADDAESAVALGGGGLGVAGGQVKIPPNLPVLPLRNLVVFPTTIMPLTVGRERASQLLDATLPRQRIIAVACQRQAQTETPGPEDLYPVGAACAILKLLRQPDGTQNIIIQGLARVRFTRFTDRDPFLKADVDVLGDILEQNTQTEAQAVTTRTLAQRVVELSPNVPDEAVAVLAGIEHPGQLADFLASNLQMDVPAKQELLEEPDVVKRLQRINGELQHQLEVLELSNRIQSQVKSNIDKSQREYYLQEQLKAIQKELGQSDEKSQEVRELREQIEKAGMPDPVKPEALRELDRLAKIPSVSPEYNVLRTYLDWMIELPWSRLSEDRLDVNLASQVLDEDHYDLQKVKRRILEYLAVRKLAPESRGPILCLAGPPGVGKTSLGQSIARALGRKFIRMSLGGMRDEAELRGHRRTYIGAMPGRVVQEIRKAGTRNPVFMLDEVDKVGADFRGDPTSALLEVLDPAQNATFQDHYLNVPFDLSRVLFIATANYMAPVPPALRDRMEVIDLPGYTQTEKLHIATRYLVPRQLVENGLKEDQARWNDAAITLIIEAYTREAGVRELERQIGTVCRGVAAMVARGQAKSRTVNRELIEDLLGPRRFESELAQRTSMPGVATGLAFTPVGGEIIFVEATSYPGRGNLTLTGQIGEVMRESAQTALSLLKSRSSELGLTLDWSKIDIHVHVPAGAVPKDGPSAGVAMFTALSSLVLGKAVRPDVAMTGEITLRGLVLPVGGIKEKTLAARQAGIRKVLLPQRNRRDLVDVPTEVLDNVEFVLVDKVDQLFEHVFSDGTRKLAKGRPAVRKPKPKARNHARAPRKNSKVRRPAKAAK